MPQNRLAAETSPYLRQHMDNPVAWEPWDADALDRARRERRPILLSVGYAACHWCHVMAHESFEDPETARVMNRHFVNIKVDREERPDIDQIYQHALALTGESGGWPLTMFLTPDGEPFWGGTYFPPTARYGRPAFRDVLTAVADTFARDPEKVAKNVTALRDGLAQLSRTQPGSGIPLATIDQVARRLAREIDPFHGGIGDAPKFPQPFVIQLLWRAWRRQRQQPFRNAVLLTLDHMSQGGIYDHLGGGYSRYSVDAVWLVPHFEKMLYDNAQLIDLLTLVWQETRRPLYAARVRETVDWMLREMRVEDAAFAAALDADSEGVEGKFYVWDEAEVDRVLGPDAGRFKSVYDVTPDGNWEGHTILNRRRHMDWLSDEEEQLADCRRRLLAARAARVRPGRDDKVLADWNGMAIAALANAGLVFDEPSWIEAARRAYDFVARRLLAAADGRRTHSWCDGRARHPATLDDHAHLARAALALHEATGEPAWIDAARRHVADADRHHWDPAEPGYFFAATDTRDLVAAVKHANDHAVPSGNAVMVDVLARLHALTGEARFRGRAEAVVGAFSGAVARNFFPLASLLNAAAFLERPLQIVLTGAAGEARARLRRAVLDVSLPDRVLTIVEPGTALPADHPAHRKAAPAGAAAAFVCAGPVCSLPIADPDELRADLERR
ncbi:thioredoxin domain-containing protein [Stella sp.]|uniref:thioredoxin domain-containing protein n=1 Tax=Stella sp. TaxID=2912054 RepID=UPI0035B1AEA0